MREMRATRGVGSGARTDVGRPALAGVLVEECDGWRGGIHGGVCLTRALGVAESDPLGHARRALFSRYERYFRVSLRLLGTAFMGPAATRRATTNDDNDEYVYRTDRHFRLHPRDASGLSAAGNDGYGGIGRGRDQTRAPAAWTHIPAGKKRSSLNSIGTSNVRQVVPRAVERTRPRPRRRTIHGVENDRPPPRASTPPAPADRARSGAGANRASGATRRRRRTAIGSVGLLTSPSTSGANP